MYGGCVDRWRSGWVGGPVVCYLDMRTPITRVIKVGIDNLVEMEI